MRLPRFASYLFSALLFASVAIVLSPINRANPNRDAGVFLYAGQQIVEGRLPYVSIWDHKPPAIYYVNAFGIFIGRGSASGVWLIELAFAAAAGIFSWRLFRRHLSPALALTCVCFWMSAWIFVAHATGNFTEEFGLPFQFGALLIAARNDESNAARDAVLVALLGACAFLFKPTNVGIWLAIGLVWIFEGKSVPLRRRILPAILAGLATLGSVGIIFRAAGIFDAFYDQFVRYNAEYSRLSSRSLSIDSELAWRLAPAGIFIAAFVSIVVLLIADRETLRHERLARIAVLALPLDLLLASATGLSYPHYFISAIPSASILLVYLGKWTIHCVDVRRMASCLAGLSIAFVFLPVLWTINAATAIALNPGSRFPEAVALARTVPSNRSFLVWGAEVEVNAMARRRAPTMYAYLYPLLTHGYSTPEKGLVFLHDIQRDPPPVIIDSSNTNPKIPPLDPVLRRTWRPERGYDRVDVVQPAIEYIERHYRPTRTLAPSGWTVWARIEQPRS